MLSWGTLKSCECGLEYVVLAQTQKMSERQEIPNEYWQVSTKANCMKLLHNAVLQCCVIGFFKVEKDSIYI